MRFFCLAVWLFASSALALSYSDIVELVKQEPKGSYTESNHGFLCEHIAKAAIQERDETATVLNGVVYGRQGRMVGELDLVVIKNDKVEEVIEVKCMKSYHGAASKANEQLARFKGHIGRCDIDFSIEGENLPCDLFSEDSIVLSKLSYQDALAAGFDYGLGISRSELLAIIKSQ